MLWLLNTEIISFISILLYLLNQNFKNIITQNYSATGIKLKLLTSNNPLSVILISGITGKDKNDSVKNGLNVIVGASILTAS